MGEENRISDERINEEYTYLDGLMYIVKVLVGELDTLLIDENRHFGIMISYLGSINQAFGRLFNEETLENEQIYQKIMFLYKPIIIKEYKKLCRRKVSRADSIIVIVHKILELVNESDDYPGKKELRTIHKVICKVFDNIRNNSKKSSLYSMVNMIRIYKDCGYIGKSPLRTISIAEEEKGKEKIPLIGSGIRLNEESENKVTELSWTDD